MTTRKKRKNRKAVSLGREGGKKTASLYPPEHFAKLAKMSHRAQKAKKRKKA